MIANLRRPGAASRKIFSSHTRSPVRIGTASAEVACLAAGFGFGHSWPQQKQAAAHQDLPRLRRDQPARRTVAGATAAPLPMPSFMSAWSTGPRRDDDSLFRLDVRGPDHLGPLVGLV